MFKKLFLIYNRPVPWQRERPLRLFKTISRLSRQRYKRCFTIERHPLKHLVKQNGSISNQKTARISIGSVLIVLAWQAIKGPASNVSTVQKILKHLHFSSRLKKI